MRVLIFLLFIVISNPGHSQDSANEIKVLDFLVGNWEVQADARLSRNGPWKSFIGNSEITQVLDSTMLEENFRSMNDDKPFYSKTLFAVNHTRHQLQRVFADSDHGPLVEFEGNKNNDAIIFDRTWQYENGTTVKLRTIYHNISKDDFNIESMRMPRDKMTWDTTGKMKYIRKQ